MLEEFHWFLRRWDIQEETLYGFMSRAIFLHCEQALTFLCWALPPHSHILICISLVKFPSSILKVPWNCLTTKFHRPQVGDSWPLCTLRLLLSGLKPNTGTKPETVLTCQTPLAPPWWLTKYHLMLFHWLRCMGSWQAVVGLGVPWAICCRPGTGSSRPRFTVWPFSLHMHPG